MRITSVAVLSALTIGIVMAFTACSPETINAYNQGEATRMAFYPTATAAANQSHLEATRVAVLGQEIARLEISRTIALDNIVLDQQRYALTETHAKAMAVVSASYAYSLMLVNSEMISREAAVSATLLTVDANTQEQIAGAKSRQAVHTGIGIGGAVFFSLLGAAAAIGAFYYFRRRGRETRPDRRTGDFPLLSEGGVMINWNKTAASAVKVYRPGVILQLTVRKMLLAGTITPGEAVAMLMPRVEQIGDSALELEAAKSADIQKAIRSATWSLTREDRRAVNKTVIDRLASQIKATVTDAIKGALPDGAIPRPRLIQISKDEMRAFESGFNIEDQPNR